MGILDNIRELFVACTEKEREAARNVIAAGTKAAATDYETLYARFPRLLAAADPSRLAAYEYGYTVAFAVMALVGANMYFPLPRRRSTTEAIAGELERWRKGAYKQDGVQLMKQLDANKEIGVEFKLAGWLFGQLDRQAGDLFKVPLHKLKREEELMTALGNLIMTQAAKAVVECFLEDRNK